jgi:hypothetical protein
MVYINSKTKNLTKNLTKPNQEKTLIFIIINFEKENHALDIIIYELKF